MGRDHAKHVQAVCRTRPRLMVETNTDRNRIGAMEGHLVTVNQKSSCHTHHENPHIDFHTDEPERHS